MSSEYLNFTGNLATTKSNLVTQGAVVIVKEVNEAIKQLARAYNNKTSKIFTLVESYKNEYDIFDELIPRVKHLSYQNAYGAWPQDKAVNLIEYDSADDTTVYEDAKTAINSTPYNKFKPPLIQPQITKGFPNIALYREIPQKFTDVRQTGRYVKVTSQTVSADLDWFITNACLYGFVVYGNDALYYVGRSYLESIVDDQEVHTKVLYAFIPDKAVALPPPPPPPPPPVGNTGGTGTGGTGTGGTGTGGTGTAGAGAAATYKITPTPKTVTKTSYTNNTPTTGKTFAYANNPNISALRNQIVKLALECYAPKPQHLIPFISGFVDNNTKDPGTNSAPNTFFEKLLKNVYFSRTPYIYSSLLPGSYAPWNGNHANPIIYINVKKTTGQPSAATVVEINSNTLDTSWCGRALKDAEGPQYVKHAKANNYPNLYQLAKVGDVVKLAGANHYCNFTTNAFWLGGYQRHINNPNFGFKSFQKDILGFDLTTQTWATGNNALAAGYAITYSDDKHFAKYKNKKKPIDLLAHLEPGDMVIVGADGGHIVMCVGVASDGSGFDYVAGNEGGSFGNCLNKGSLKTYHPKKGYLQIQVIVKLPNKITPNDPKNKPFIF